MGTSRMQGIKQKQDSGIAYGGCDGHVRLNKDLPLVDELGFSGNEKTILEMIRHFSCATALPGYDGFERAIECAQFEWPPYSLPNLLDALRRLLAVMRRTRSGSFDFIVPDCPCCCKHICQSELELMLMLRAACQKNIPRLNTAARLVADGGEPAALVRAANCVADQLNRISGSDAASPALH